MQRDAYYDDEDEEEYDSEEEEFLASKKKSTSFSLGQIITEAPPKTEVKPTSAPLAVSAPAKDPTKKAFLKISKENIPTNLSAAEQSECKAKQTSEIEVLRKAYKDLKLEPSAAASKSVVFRFHISVTRSVYTGEEVLGVTVEYPPLYPIASPVITFESVKNIDAKALATLKELARVRLITAFPHSGLMSHIQKWLSSDDNRRESIYEKALTKERVFLRSGRAIDDEQELELEAEEFEKEKLAQAVAAAEAAAALQLQTPVPPPKQYFQVGGEDESVSQNYVTSGTAKCAPLEMRDNVLPELGYHNTIRYGSNLIVFGGEDKEQKLRNDVYEINLVNKTTRRIVPSGLAPEERKGAAACRVGHWIWFFGGRIATDQAYQPTNSRAIFALDLQKWEWFWPQRHGDIILPHRMAFHSAVKLWDNRILLYGGQKDNHAILNTDLVVFDCDRMECYFPEMYNKSMPWPKPRSGHSALMYQNKMILFGGIGGTSYSDLWYLDTTNWKWTGPIETTGYVPPRSSCAIDRFGSKLIIFGGECAGASLNDLRIFDLMTSSWKQKQYADAPPEPRKGHSGCMIGSTFVLVGGGSDNIATRNSRSLYGFVFRSTVATLAPTSEILRIDIGPRVIQLPRPTIGNDFLKIFREKILVDIWIECKKSDHSLADDKKAKQQDSISNGHLYAHRAIVSARAPKLWALVPKDKPKEDQYFKIQFLENAVAAVQMLLEFIYSDTVSAPAKYDRAVLEEAKALAQRFELSRMDAQIVAIMKSDHTPPKDTSIPTTMISLLDDPHKLSDFTVRVGDRVFKTHKCILHSRSSYFRTLFQSGMIEAQKGEISLSEMSSQVFEVALRFILTDECVLDDPERAVELLSVAGLFDLPRLRILCESIIDLNYDFDDADNVLQLLQYADAHRAIHIISLCSYILTQVIGQKAMEKTESWKSLSPALQQRLLKATKY